MGDIIVAFLLQLLFTVGFIAAFGIVISLCNKLFYRNLGEKSGAVCYVTGCIGTPVHELSHALFCLIFGHKILEIKLYDVSSEDGTLGYVRHSYNRRNVWQNIGSFFIGVAPIIVISALLYFFAFLLLKDFFGAVSAADFSFDNAAGACEAIGILVTSFFKSALSWRFWLFILIGLFLAPHMTLSTADIKNAWSGATLLVVVLFIVDLIIGLVSKNMLTSFTSAVVGIGGRLLCFFIVALLICLIEIVISFIVKLIRRRV